MLFLRAPFHSPSWRPYALGASIVVALMLLVAGLSAWQARERALERTETTARNLAHVIEAQLAQSLDILDQDMKGAAQRLTEELARGRSLAKAADRVEAGWTVPEGRGLLPGKLRVLDLQGRTMAPGAQPMVSAATAQALVANQGMAITPLDASQAASPPGAPEALLLTRAVADVNGRPVALLSAAVPTLSLGRYFEGLELGPQGAATLRSADLALLYRKSGTPAPAGSAPAATGSRTVSTALRDAITAHPRQGHYVATVPIDDIERSNAYRRVGRHPMYVIIGLATEDEMRGWRTQLAQTGALALTAAGISIALAVVLYRSAQRRLHSANARFEAIVQSSTDAIISKTLDGRVTSWNPGAQAVFGYTADEMIGQPLRRLLPPDRVDEEEAILARIQQGEVVPPFETERLHKDGHRFDVSISLSPLRDEQGQIIGASKIARDITRQKRMEAEVRELAFLDPLTRLPNRRLLTDRLRQAQATTTRRREYAAVLFVDLDGFKQINDRHGHEIGDRILVDVAQRLRRAVREIDTVARLGGDEFVLVCEALGTDQDEALGHAVRLVAKVRELLAEPGASDLPPCTGSVGVHVFQGSSASPEELIRAADLAMYLDKSARRTAEPA